MILPSFVYSATDRCDMRCEYCPTEGPGSYGENFEMAAHPLSPSDVAWTAALAGEFGLGTFRLTGGEPLLDISRAAAILRGVVDSGCYSNVRLNTNGGRLLEAIAQLREIPINALKVSLDTLDPTLFQKLTNSKKFDSVVKGIEAAVANGLPIELNAVLTNETASGMLDLATWSQERGIPLKILDVVRYSSQPAEYADMSKTSQAELSHRLEERFGPPAIVQLSNSRGILMKRYGTEPYVLFKDCSEGTTFTTYCRGCPQFPCEEGIHHLSLSTDGHLRPCRLRNNVFWDVRPIVTRRDETGLRRLIRFLLETAYVGEFTAVSPQAMSA